MILFAQRSNHARELKHTLAKPVGTATNS